MSDEAVITGAGSDTEQRNGAPGGDDALLVIAALLGDLVAFETLVCRYRGAVTLVAQQILGSRAAAEDVAQDTFVIAFQALPDLDDPARFPGWLRAIARHRACRAVARARRDQPTDTESLNLLLEHRSPDRTVAGDPARNLQQQAGRDAVWEALDRLSGEHREALYLHYCEEWPLARIAEFLTVPETTVKGRLYRAREALRRVLDETNEDDEALLMGEAPHRRKGRK